MARRTTPHLSEAVEQYQRTRAVHVARSTLINDQSVLRRFVEGVNDPQVHLLTPERAEAWFATEAGRQSASSYNKVLQRVRGLLGFCQRRGWLAHDPLSELRPRPVPRKDRLQLSVSQLRALVECTENPRDRAIIATSVNTGLRASDLVALRIRDVDLDEGWLRTTIQKTNDVDRLPITSDLDAELRRWLSYYTERLAAHGQRLESDARLFPSLGSCNTVRGQVWGDPKPYVPANRPSAIVHRALMRIGIFETSQEGFHTIRRSVGRQVFELALESGHDGALRTAAALLGHKSTATTEIYLGIQSDRMKRDALLRGKSLLGAPAQDNVVRLDSIG
jgi:integrase